jgi:hypothetical protein
MLEPLWLDLPSDRNVQSSAGYPKAASVSWTEKLDKTWHLLDHYAEHVKRGLRSHGRIRIETRQQIGLETEFV